MKLKVNYFYYIIIFLFSLILSHISWDYYRGLVSVDRNNYYNYFAYGVNRIDYLDFNNIIDFLKNEWLWHFLIGFLKNFIYLDSIFNIIGFLIVFFSSYYIFDKTKNIYYIFFLINPLFIDLMHSQLRISLAITLFLIYLINRSFLRYLFLISSFFIHTVMVGVFLLYILCFFIYKRNIDFRLKIIYSSFLGMFFSIIFGPLRESILKYIGDRRINYNQEVLDSSIAYLSFWIVMLIAFYIQFLIFNLKIKLKGDYILFAVSILSLVFFNIYFGGYSTRFLAFSMPFLVVLLASFLNFYKLIFIYLYIFYMFFYFIIWW